MSSRIYNSVYSRIVWQNKEDSQTTPLGATNLNKGDYALKIHDDRIIELNNVKAEQSDLLQTVNRIEYNSSSGIIKFHFWNGTIVNVDINVEKIPVAFSMDEFGVITMETADGEKYTADVSTLIKTYGVMDTETVAMTHTVDSVGNHTFTAQVKKGSITGEYLQPDYLADIQVQAQSVATNVQNAIDSANSSSSNALLSKSYAVGDANGTRYNENFDNAKYYCNIAKAVANVDIATTTVAGLVMPDGTTISVDESGKISSKVTPFDLKFKQGVVSGLQRATTTHDQTTYQVAYGSNAKIELRPIFADINNISGVTSTTRDITGVKVKFTNQYTYGKLYKRYDNVAYDMNSIGIYYMERTPVQLTYDSTKNIDYIQFTDTIVIGDLKSGTTISNPTFINQETITSGTHSVSELGDTLNHLKNGFYVVSIDSGMPFTDAMVFYEKEVITLDTIDVEPDVPIEVGADYEFGFNKSGYFEYEVTGYDPSHSATTVNVTSTSSYDSQISLFSNWCDNLIYGIFPYQINQVVQTTDKLDNDKMTIKYGGLVWELISTDLLGGHTIYTWVRTA